MSNLLIPIDSLGKELGKGSYGAVNKIDERSALKSFYKRDLSKYEEITVVSMINHPNIVAFQGLGVYDENIGLLMELCQMTLDKYLELPIVKENIPAEYSAFTVVDNAEGQFRYPFKREHYFDACNQLLSAIGCLHKAHITHADIKGNNVMVKDGRLVLGDFGLCVQSHVSGKRDINLCATVEWRPLDIINISGGDEFKKIIPIASDRMNEWLVSVTEYYTDVIELYQVDIYSIGLIILSILIGKPQPHSPLDEHNMYRLLEEWHRNCTTRSLQTIRNYLRRMENWPGIPGMSDFLSRMITSSPWLRYHTIEEALSHSIFVENGYNEPIRGTVRYNKWRIDRSIPLVDRSIYDEAFQLFKSYRPISSMSPSLISEGIAYIVGYICYINQLRHNMVIHKEYKYNPKINSKDFIVRVAVNMTYASLYGDVNLLNDANRIKYPTMFDDYMVLSNGKMFLRPEWSSSSITRLAPLGYYFTNDCECDSLKEYIIAVERSIIKHPFSAISRKYKLSNDEQRLNMHNYFALIEEILDIVYKK